VVEKLVLDLLQVAKGLNGSRQAKKSRPNDLFAGYFWDVREKAKGLKNKWSDEVRTKLEEELLADLRANGVNVESHKLSLGQYRGSKFMTSAKLSLSGVKDSEGLLTWLRGKYSPKFKIKSEDKEAGTVSLNIR